MNAEEGAHTRPVDGSPAPTEGHSPVPRDMNPRVHGTLLCSVKNISGMDIHVHPTYISYECRRRDLNPQEIALTRT